MATENPMNYRDQELKQAHAAGSIRTYEAEPEPHGPRPPATEEILIRLNALNEAFNGAANRLDRQVDRLIGTGGDARRDGQENIETPSITMVEQINDSITLLNWEADRLHTALNHLERL